MTERCTERWTSGYEITCVCMCSNTEYKIIGCDIVTTVSHERQIGRERASDLGIEEEVNCRAQVWS